jgi:hypothetical protein
MRFDKAAALTDINGAIHDGQHPPAPLAGSTGAEYGCSLFAESVRRLTPPDSHYRAMVQHAMGHKAVTARYQALLGIAVALRADIIADRLRTFEEMLHSALFTDFLAGAEHLLEEGWPLPSAVTAGATLEEHLRQLAIKHGVSLDVTKGGQTKPKMASTLNDELYSQAKAYSSAHHSLILGWIQIRNEAAHGKPEFQKRTKNEIQHMIGGIRELIASHPA